MTALAVVGTGLVTPLARTPAEHAFFVRADVGAAAPGAFIDEDGESIPVAYCAWLGALLPVAERLRALGTHALRDALRPLDAGTDRSSLAVLVVSAAPRTGLNEADRDALEAVLAPNAKRLTGEAGFFDGLARAGRMLASGEARWVAIVAADSFTAPAYLAEHRRLAATAWDADHPRPAEGAAAVLLTTMAAAKDAELTVLATINLAATTPGLASDENDDAPDGSAVATLLRAVPEVCQPVSASFGQHAVGSVREREWELAAARCASVLEPECALLSLEAALGALGAAAGAAAFVYGVAVHQHDAWPTADGSRPAKPFIVWGISPSGTCGLAAVTPEPMNAAPGKPGRPPSRGTQRATWARPHAMTLHGAEIVAAVFPEVEPAQGTPDAPVRIDSTCATPLPVWACQASVIADCLERMSMLGRHRDERPLRERASIEVRLLAHLDALVAAGARIDDLDHFWQHHAEDDPWVTWAVVFVLGTVEGPDALDAIAHLVEGLPSDASDHAQLAAAALVVSPHADRALLIRGLLRSPGPLARAVAVELLSILGVLDLDVAIPLLDDPTAGARAAALRALARASTSIEPILPRVRAALRDRDPAVAWEAARLLTLFQHSEPSVEVRDAGPLATKLGARALDLLALVGSPDDLPTVQRITKHLPMSGDVLSAVARFGHPAAWTYLIRGLERPDLADEALRALVTLFGPLVEDANAREAEAWRAALAIVDIPQGTRWRGGAAWSPSAVRAECAGGDLSGLEVEQRCDELRAVFALARNDHGSVHEMGRSAWR